MPKKFNPSELWAKCKNCLQSQNLDNLIKHKSPIKKLYGAFTQVYFCSENCKGLWSNQN